MPVFLIIKIIKNIHTNSNFAHELLKCEIWISVYIPNLLHLRLCMPSNALDLTEKTLFSVNWRKNTFYPTNDQTKTRPAKYFDDCHDILLPVTFLLWRHFFHDIINATFDETP